MEVGSLVITALGQLKQPRKWVQSSPAWDPGAIPASGSLQSNPNIDMALPPSADVSAEPPRLVDATETSRSRCPR